MARTPKLTDLQLILLSTAAARDDGNVFPLKDCIAGKAAEVAKAIIALLKRRLVVEHPETVLVRVWREDTGERVGLAITDAGRALVNGGADETGKEDASTETDEQPVAPPQPSSKPQSKSAMVLGLLARPDGATLPELIEATGWLPHTTRAALTGVRKKGHAVERTKRDGVTCYRIATAA
jgi:hypothetical protein